MHFFIHLVTRAMASGSVPGPTILTDFNFLQKYCPDPSSCIVRLPQSYGKHDTYVVPIGNLPRCNADPSANVCMEDFPTDSHDPAFGNDCDYNSANEEKLRNRPQQYTKPVCQTNAQSSVSYPSPASDCADDGCFANWITSPYLCHWSNLWGGADPAVNMREDACKSTSQSVNEICNNKDAWVISDMRQCGVDSDEQCPDTVNKQWTSFNNTVDVVDQLKNAKVEMVWKRSQDLKGDDNIYNDVQLIRGTTNAQNCPDPYELVGSINTGGQWTTWAACALKQPKKELCPQVPSSQPSYKDMTGDMTGSEKELSYFYSLSNDKMYDFLRTGNKNGGAVNLTFEYAKPDDTQIVPATNTQQQLFVQNHTTEPETAHDGVWWEFVPNKPGMLAVHHGRPATKTIEGWFFGFVQYNPHDNKGCPIVLTRPRFDSTFIGRYIITQGDSGFIEYVNFTVSIPNNDLGNLYSGFTNGGYNLYNDYIKSRGFEKLCCKLDSDAPSDYKEICRNANYTEGTASCDSYMDGYCKGNPTDPVCACSSHAYYDSSSNAGMVYDYFRKEAAAGQGFVPVGKECLFAACEAPSAYKNHDQLNSKCPQVCAQISNISGDVINAGKMIMDCGGRKYEPGVPGSKPDPSGEIPGKSSSSSRKPGGHRTLIVVACVVGGMLLLIVVAIIIAMSRKSRTNHDLEQQHDDDDDDYGDDN